MNRAPTISDVAREAGVSRSTAARAMSGEGYVDAEKRRQIEAAAERLGYRGSAIARALRTRRSNTVGILIADISNPIFPKIVRGADGVLSAEGLTILLGNTDGEAAKQLAFVRNMLDRQADGLILVSQSIPDEVTELLRKGPPCVFVNRTPDPDAFDYVGPDNHAGVALLLDHLAGLGHRDVAFLSGPLSSSTARERTRAFRQLAPDYGIRVRPEWILACGYEYDDGRIAAQELLSRPETPTAIIGSNDFAAMGVIAEARSRGVDVPGALSVSGYDGAFREPIWEALFPAGPRLTTIAQPRLLIGAGAARMLLDRIGDPARPPAREVLPVTRITGNTTGTCASAHHRTAS